MSEVKVWAGLAPSEAAGGGSFLPLAAPGASGVPWLVAACLQSLPPSSPGLLLFCRSNLPCVSSDFGR